MITSFFSGIRWCFEDAPKRMRRSLIWLQTLLYLVPFCLSSGEQGVFFVFVQTKQYTFAASQNDPMIGVVIFRGNGGYGPEGSVVNGYENTGAALQMQIFPHDF